MQFLRIGLALTTLAVAAPAFADSTVNVKLWDKNGDMNADAKMGMGMPANMSMAMMKIQVDKKVVPARKVTFDVTNTAPPGMALNLEGTIRIQASGASSDGFYGTLDRYHGMLDEVLGDLADELGAQCRLIVPPHLAKRARIGDHQYVLAGFLAGLLVQVVRDRCSKVVFSQPGVVRIGG